MNVVCPKCGHPFDVQTRASQGQGTQRGKSIGKLNPNKKAILQILQQQMGQKFTVRQVQGTLYSMGVKRWRTGDGDRSTGEWNYHHVQVDLSLLVGKGLVKMTQDSEEYWDTKEQRHKARPIPRYWVDSAQQVF
jgi:hypothetical protein